jgi:hypothetical protein
MGEPFPESFAPRVNLLIRFPLFVIGWFKQKVAMACYVLLWNTRPKSGKAQNGIHEIGYRLKAKGKELKLRKEYLEERLLLFPHP